MNATDANTIWKAITLKICSGRKAGEASKNGLYRKMAHEVGSLSL